MIDTHAHILPGIDDGAKTFEDSIAMLRRAEANDITDIILTPHYLRGTKYNTQNAKKWELYQELKEKTSSAGININLYLGNEIYIDAGLPEMLAGYVGKKTDLMYEVSTLNSTKYVLVELPVRAEERTAKSILMAVIKMGFVPLIAHPERYYYVQDNLEVVNEYLKMGCLLSGDILALVGKYGKREERTLKKLLHDNRIFCLATDAHKPADYELGGAKKKLLKIVREEAIIEELTIGNPRRIIGGK